VEAKAEARLLAPEEGGRIMEFGMFVSWVVVGLLAGGLAGIVMKGGGYGLIGDLGLGLAGSATVVVAFVGAVIVIVAQRKVWTHA
jgi:uncharacterized membrane protein YeaQ/YmgE (transglycosylase-associated protein family)